MAQRPVLNAPMTEVPVLVPEKHSLPKADFSSSDNAVEFPFLPMKVLEPLFTGIVHTLLTLLFARCSAHEGAGSTPLKDKVVRPA